eukprot:COSAG02_NODE_21627_length_781_cov_0.662757_1_plen_114_part_10
MNASLAPSWNQVFEVSIPVDGCKLRVEVLDSDLTSDDFLGQCTLDVGAGDAAVLSKQSVPLARLEGKRTGEWCGELTLWLGQPGSEPEAEAAPEPLMRSLMIMRAAGQTGADLL